MERQKIAETPADDTTERLSETQTKVATEPTENDRGPVGDPVRDSTVDPVGGHGGQLTGGTQSQPQQNRDLTEGA